MSTTNRGRPGPAAGGPEPAPPSRLSWLLDRLQHEGRIDVLSVAGRLQVAPETIRRDLRVLEEDGKLLRVHGGAVPIQTSTTPTASAEDDLDFSRALWGRLPTSGTILIGVGSGLGVGSGGAPLRLARAIEADPPTGPGLTVITRALDAAVVLSRVPTIAVYNLGGVVSAGNHAQQGDWALTELRRLHLDVAVLWPDGVRADTGLSAGSTVAAAAAQAEVASARRVLAVADQDAVGTSSFVGYAAIDQVDELVLPAGAVVDDAEVGAIARAGVPISRL